MHEQDVQKQVDALTVRVQRIADSLALLTQMTAKAPGGETLIAIVQEIRQRVQTLQSPRQGWAAQPLRSPSTDSIDSRILRSRAPSVQRLADSWL
jgi:hypothetical protein